MYLDLGGTSLVSLDIKAASKQEAEAIFNHIQESHRVPTCQTAQGSLVTSTARLTHHEPEVEEEPSIEPGPEGRQATLSYNSQAETEKVPSRKENEKFPHPDYTSSDEWRRVHHEDQVGVTPAPYAKVCLPLLTLYVMNWTRRVVDRNN